MTMKAIYYTLSITWKEIQIILRDRFWMVILFLLPLLIGGFMGAINLATNPPAGEKGEKKGILLRIGLVNLDTGGFGTEVSKAIQGIDQFEVQEFNAVDQAEAVVTQGDLTSAIIIPADFSEKINAYTPTAIEVMVDPAQPEGASIVTGIINQVVGEVTIWGEVQHGVRSIFEESGLLAQASPQEQRAIEAQNLGVIMTRINEMRRNPAILVVSENLQGAKIQGGIELFIAYLFAGLTVMFIFFIVTMCSTSLLAEREAGTIRRLLSAPAPRGTIIAGKTLAFMLLGCVQVVVMFTVANLLLRAPLGRSPLALVVLTLAVTFTAAAMGMMVAALAKTASQAGSIGLILAFVLAALGGALPAASKEPLGRAGGFMGVISKFTPHSYAVEGYYRVMAENETFIQILPEIGILLAFGVVFFLIAVWRFKFET
jgi:ABC-2 type transport system permease protein